MNKQIKSHWRLAFRTFKTALKVTFSLPYRVHKASLYDLLVMPKIDRQREGLQTLDIDSFTLPHQKFPAVTYLKFLDKLILESTSTTERNQLQRIEKEFIKTYGISKDDLDNGYFVKQKKKTVYGLECQK